MVRCLELEAAGAVVGAFAFSTTSDRLFFCQKFDFKEVL